jgi:hypothetical protein
MTDPSVFSQGGIYQEAVSGVTYTDPDAYELSGGGFATVRFPSSLFCITDRY